MAFLLYNYIRKIRGGYNMSNFNDRAKEWDTESKIERSNTIAKSIKNKKKYLLFLLVGKK